MSLGRYSIRLFRLTQRRNINNNKLTVNLWSLSIRIAFAFAWSWLVNFPLLNLVHTQIVCRIGFEMSNIFTLLPFTVLWSPCFILFTSNCSLQSAHIISIQMSLHLHTKVKKYTQKANENTIILCCETEQLDFHWKMPKRGAFKGGRNWNQGNRYSENKYDGEYGRNSSIFLFSHFVHISVFRSHYVRAWQNMFHNMRNLRFYFRFL